MSVTIENLGNLDRKITLQFNRADVNQAREARLTRLGKSMKMPGFRPGKVPKKMVEQQYGMQVDFEVQYDKASQLFYEVSKKEGIKLASQPRLEPKSEIGADEVVFDAFFEVLPEVKIGDFASSELIRYTTEVNDPEIDRALDVLRKQRVHYHSRGEAGDHGDGGSDTSAQKDDQVTLDFMGKIDGVEFAGGKAEDFKFVIGAGQMLPEFEAAALGLKKGESKTFPLSFPADYHGKDVAGKTAEFTITTPTLETRERSADGTEKFLLRLDDGKQLESVFIPDTPAMTFCVSTQVGCAMACAFCLTGKMGLVRNLTAGEIAGQVRVLANALDLRDKPFNIVLMGMGEPLHNYDNTMKALRMLHSTYGLAVSPRRVTLSTVGIVPALERLGREALMPNLAISLHATTDEQRTALVPPNRKYPLAAILDASLRMFVRRVDSAREFSRHEIVRAAVVAAEHHQRLLAQAELLEFRHDLADLLIHVSDVVVVIIHALPGGGLRVRRA